MSQRHHTSADFWSSYRSLPVETRELADRAFSILKVDSRHPSLQLKKVGRFWSVRVGLYHRALAAEVPGGFLWFWIGNHAEYDKLIG